jgi:hypothetical protein
VWISRDEVADGNEAANAMLSESYADYESGGYSPQYLSQSQLDPGTFVMNEEDDLQRLVFARMQVQGTGSRVEVSTDVEPSGWISFLRLHCAGCDDCLISVDQSVIAAEEQALQREARKGMTADEAEFSVETALDSQVYLWSDKYRPRKPRYFNR